MKSQEREMESLVLPALLAMLALFMLLKLIFSWWISPIQTHHKLKRCGFGGPSPSFPLGNIQEMKKKNGFISSLGCSKLTHDIHSTVFPYFSRWQNSHGKVFIYWLGTEPFLYIAEPEFLKKMSTEIMAKRWGKPNVFRNDRDPMFGKGLVMAEGNEWVHHRHVIALAFSPLNLKAMTSMMIDTTNQMIDRWMTQINFGNHELDVEREVIATAAEIIARTSFGMKVEDANKVSEKIRALQMILFKTIRHVGVPFGKCTFDMKKTLEAKKLGKEIDRLMLSVIIDRKKSSIKRQAREDILDLLLQSNHQVDGKLVKTFTTRQLVDECKTLFFAGIETSALAISWTLLLLAIHEDWQIRLRDEIREVVGDRQVDVNVLAGLKKSSNNDAIRDLIFTAEKNTKSPSSTAKLECKPTFNPFLFGSFESVNLLEEEKVSPASIFGKASLCLSSNPSGISASRSKVASARVANVVGSVHLHRPGEAILKMLSLGSFSEVKIRQMLGNTPDHSTFSFFSTTCGDFSSFSLDGSLHVVIYQSGKTMYGSCGALHHAREMFDVLCHRGVLQNEIGWFDKSENTVCSLTSRIINNTSMVKIIITDRMSMIVQCVSSIQIATVVSMIFNWRMSLVAWVVMPCHFIGGLIQAKSTKGVLGTTPLHILSLLLLHRSLQPT